MEGHIDRKILNGIRDMMPAKFPELVEKYLKSATGYIGGAAEAAAGRDAVGVVDSVHPLKSSSASLGLSRLAQLAQDVETIALSMKKASDEDWVAVTGGLEAIEEAFNIAETALRTVVDEGA